MKITKLLDVVQTQKGPLYLYSTDTDGLVYLHDYVEIEPEFDYIQPDVFNIFKQEEKKDFASYLEYAKHHTKYNAINPYSLRDRVLSCPVKKELWPSALDSVYNKRNLW